MRPPPMTTVERQASLVTRSRRVLRRSQRIFRLQDSSHLTGSADSAVRTPRHGSFQADLRTASARWVSLDPWRIQGGIRRSLGATRALTDWGTSGAAWLLVLVDHCRGHHHDCCRDGGRHRRRGRHVHRGPARVLAEGRGGSGVRASHRDAGDAAHRGNRHHHRPGRRSAGSGARCWRRYLATGAVQAGRFVVDRMEDRLRVRGSFVDRVIVLADGRDATDVLDLITEHAEAGWTILGCVGACAPEAARAGCGPHRCQRRSRADGVGHQRVDRRRDG